MSNFKDFIKENNIQLANKDDLYSYIDLNGQEWLINRVNTEFKHPTRRNQSCEFTATNGAGIVDTPIKGNFDNKQFIATFNEGIELLKSGYKP
tara:strand:- start:220 stop:498 length:279 start_codon:yes stop_codon:yes gene_type:complete